MSPSAWGRSVVGVLRNQLGRRLRSASYRLALDELFSSSSLVTTSPLRAGAGSRLRAWLLAPPHAERTATVASDRAVERAFKGCSCGTVAHRSYLARRQLATALLNSPSRTARRRDRRAPGASPPLPLAPGGPPPPHRYARPRPARAASARRAAAPAAAAPAALRSRAATTWATPPGGRSSARAATCRPRSQAAHAPPFPPRLSLLHATPAAPPRPPSSSPPTAAHPAYNQF